MSYHNSSQIVNKSSKSPYFDIPAINGVFTLPINAICKAVLLCILCHQKYGKYKHFSELYKEVGCGESSVKKALNNLVKEGYLLREQRGQYLITFDGEQGAWLNLSYYQSVSTTRMGYVKKLVLFSLSKYMSQEEFECYPKIETISKVCSLSPKTVSKALSELQTQGVIRRFKRNGKWHIKAILKAMREVKKATPDVSNHEMKAISGGICKNNNNKKYNKNLQSFSLQDKFNSYEKKKNKEGGKYHKVNNQTKKPNSTLAQLYQLWGSKASKANSNEETVPLYLNGKAKGQITYFCKAIQSIGGDPIKLMGDCIDNWAGYCAEIHNSTNYQKTPSRPNIGFFVKNLNEFNIISTKKYGEKQKINSPTKQKTSSKIMTDEEYKKKMAEWFKDD